MFFSLSPMTAAHALAAGAVPHFPNTCWRSDDAESYRLRRQLLAGLQQAQRLLHLLGRLEGRVVARQRLVVVLVVV